VFNGVRNSLGIGFEIVTVFFLVVRNPFFRCAFSAWVGGGVFARLLCIMIAPG